MATKRRRFWGWGYEGEGPSRQERERLRQSLERAWGAKLRWRRPPSLDEIELRPPRLEPPEPLERLIASDKYQRVAHAYGKSYRDVVRALRADFPEPPDLVLFPRSEQDIVDALDWCGEAGAAVIPFGGGSSVVGGVEPIVGDGYRGVVTVDMSLLDRVIEVDTVSRAARIQAGVLGPALEDQLRSNNLTLRHYPQSFEFSSLGGWIATRSGGHYATLHTHIDDFVESIRTVTPAGVLETLRLPASGAGPSPDRMLLGSEGTLGIITEAWMRLQQRPRYRSSAAVRFGDFQHGVAAARSLAQSNLFPSNCRLLDPLESLTSGAGDGSAAVLLVGFESAHNPVDSMLGSAIDICADLGGERPPSSDGEAGTRARPRGVDAWRRSFLAAPYLRDALVSMGVLCETFETATTWDQFPVLHQAVMSVAAEALQEIGAPSGWVTCRLTHVYPDGAAPYFTVLAPSRPGAEIEQWASVKEAVSAAVRGCGATITHHHAVGRDHRRWYDGQRPGLFAEALAGAKSALDPGWIMNPGVLLDRT